MKMSSAMKTLVADQRHWHPTKETTDRDACRCVFRRQMQKAHGSSIREPVIDRDVLMAKEPVDDVRAKPIACFDAVVVVDLPV